MDDERRSKKARLISVTEDDELEDAPQFIENHEKFERMSTETEGVEADEAMEQSADSDDPSSSSTTELPADKNCILCLLPEYIWNRLIDNLAKWGQFELLKTLSNSSLYFRDLLLTKHTRYLFPLVWPILGKKYEERNSEMFEKRGRVEIIQDFNNANQDDHPYNESSGFSNDHEASFEIIICESCGRRRYVRWFSGILKLRLICKTWCTAVDNFYQRSRQLYYSEDNAVMMLIEGNLHWSWCKFDIIEPKTCHQFCQHFEKTHQGTHRSPFVGKSVFLDYYVDGDEVEHEDDQEENHEIDHEENHEDESYDEKWRQYFDGIQSLLENYGKHIQTCTIMEHPLYTRVRRHAYKLMQSFLENMPNLVVLELSYGVPDDWPTPPLSVKEVVQETETISLYPTPKLESLEFMQFENLPDNTLIELLGRNNHISKLFLPNWRPGKYPGLVLVKLQNLTELRCEFHTVDFLATIGDPRITWPLRKLYLCIDANCKNANLSELFSILHGKWANTLTELILHIDVPIGDSTSSSVRLYLNKLQKLSLVLPDHSPLDFILSVKDTLQHLDICIRRKTYGYSTADDNVEGTMELSLRYKELLASIVPPSKTFPNLKNFGFRQIFH